MFAVSGWNVPTTKLVSEHSQRSSAAGTAKQGNDSKKRKRPDRDVEKSRKIKAGELEKLWDQRFGEQPSKNSPGKHAEAAGPGRKDGPFQSRSQEKSTPGKLHSNVRDAAVTAAPSSTNKSVRHDKKSRNEVPDTRPKKHNERSPHSKTQDSALKKDHKPEKPSKNAHSKPQTPREDATASLASLPPPPPPTTALTPLQAKMRAKLTSARFRHLNETLYTTSSSTALSLFATTPSLFTEYHAGFSHQVSSSWPLNPVDVFISAVKSRGVVKDTDSTNRGTRAGEVGKVVAAPLPRRKTGSCTIADLGCGDAPLARGLIPKWTKKLGLTIHSYDLHAPNSHVTVADVANLPLRDGEADLAIFCLSLMGTNWVEFVEECWRVLRGDGRGEVWVAEVKSRFGRVGEKHAGGGKGRRVAGEAVGHSVGKRQKAAAGGKKGKKKGADGEDEDLNEADLPADLFTDAARTTNMVNGAAEEETPDLAPFINVFASRGFQLKPNSVDASNKMFVSMTFFKSGIPTKGKHKGMKWTGKQYERVGKADSDDEEERAEEGKVLKPCVYKTR